MKYDVIEVIVNKYYPDTVRSSLTEDLKALREFSMKQLERHGMTKIYK